LRSLVDAFVKGCKSDGVWTGLKALWVPRALDSNAARVNWKTPGTGDYTVNGSPTFTAKSGINANAAGTNSLATGVSPSALTGQNTAGVFLWTVNGSTNANYDMTDPNTVFTFSLRAQDSALRARIHTSTNASLTTMPAQTGFLSCRRISGTQIQFYDKTGAPYGAAVASTSAAPAATSFNLLGNYPLTGSTSTDRGLGCAGIYDNYTDANVLALRNRIETLMTGIAAL
jgi:hypothetical protein